MQSATRSRRRLTLSILSLIVPPSIVADPYKESVSEGSPASFTVGASGTGQLSYQWLLNGAPIAGATTATISMPSAQVSDAGTYSAVVSSSTGSSQSAGAVLTVSPEPTAPIFEYQPAATFVTVGGTATLGVGVVGTPPITYQWSKGGTAIPGATSSSLNFTSVAAANAGVYTVAITDPVGTVTSSAATLTVDPVGGPPVPVSIELQPTPVSTPGRRRGDLQRGGDGGSLDHLPVAQEPVPHHRGGRERPSRSTTCSRPTQRPTTSRWPTASRPPSRSRLR
jgi:hypothetical protein